MPRRIEIGALHKIRLAADHQGQRPVIGALLRPGNRCIDERKITLCEILGEAFGIDGRRRGAVDHKGAGLRRLDWRIASEQGCAHHLAVAKHGDDCILVGASLARGGDRFGAAAVLEILPCGLRGIKRGDRKARPHQVDGHAAAHGA